jgi:hypothetical protein
MSHWCVRANMTQGRRAVGGHLEVAGSVLRFRPSGFDKATGSGGFEVQLADLKGVDVVPRTWNLFDGGLRSRLRLQLADGGHALFVVSRPSEVAERISQAMSAD